MVRSTGNLSSLYKECLLSGFDVINAKAWLRGLCVFNM